MSEEAYKQYAEAESDVQTLVDDLLQAACGHDNDEAFLRDYFSARIQEWRWRRNASERDPE